MGDSQTFVNTEPGRQHTLAASFSVEGYGVHTNRHCRVTVAPAPAGTGVVFEVADRNGVVHTVPAALDSASGRPHRRQTILGDPAGVHVATPEHLLSALRAMNVDNAFVRLSEPELPLLDGGSREFADRIAEVGVLAQDAQRQAVVITRPVSFVSGDDIARFTAHPFEGLRVTCFVDFGDAVVGRMGASFEITPAVYRDEIAPARTIAFEREIEALRRSGLGLGGSLDSVVVIGERGYLNDRLHFADEVARHKILDLIGDLALLGRPIQGHIIAERTGHADNVRFAQYLKEMFE